MARQLGKESATAHSKAAVQDTRLHDNQSLARRQHALPCSTLHPRRLLSKAGRAQAEGPEPHPLAAQSSSMNSWHPAKTAGLLECLNTAPPRQSRPHPIDAGGRSLPCDVPPCLMSAVPGNRCPAHDDKEHSKGKQVVNWPDTQACRWSTFTSAMTGRGVPQHKHAPPVLTGGTARE